MMSSKPWSLSGVGALLVGACGNNPATPPPMDVPATTDARPGDARPTDARPADRPPTADPCVGARDISAVPPDADGAIHVMGDSRAAPPTMLGALPPSCLLSEGEKGRPVVFRYTTHTTSLLRVSAANPGTDSSFDTVIAVLSTCTETSVPIACNDDLGASDLRSTATTTGAVPSGTTVFIVVGSWAASAKQANGAAFELSVRELPLIPAGSPCHDGDVCAEGVNCLRTGVDPTVRQCVSDGASGGLCRTAGVACQPGLTCSQATPTSTNTGTCRSLVAVGAECDRIGRTTGCVAGAACVASAADSNRFVCAADGTRGTRCRADAPRCNAGLECSTAAVPTCRETVTMAGGVCDLSASAVVCGAGLSCAPNATFSAGTCAPLGAAPGVACRPDAPRCDGALRCSTPSGAGFCRTSVAVGMPCDAMYNTTACADDGACGALPGGAHACFAIAAEREPNNTPATAQMAASATTRFTASLTPGADVDCFGVVVPAMGSLFVETNLPATPECPLGTSAAPNPDTIATVYNSAGVVIAENDDSRMGVCSQIDPTTTPSVRGLAAGTYTVCVRGYGASPVAIASYTVTVAAQAR